MCCKQTFRWLGWQVIRVLYHRHNASGLYRTDPSIHSYTYSIRRNNRLTSTSAQIRAPEALDVNHNPRSAHMLYNR